MTVSRWERGDTEPSAKDLARAAEKLGVNPEWLAWGRGSAADDPEPAALVERAVAAVERAARKRRAA